MFDSDGRHKGKGKTPLKVEAIDGQYAALINGAYKQFNELYTSIAGLENRGQKQSAVQRLHSLYEIMLQTIPAGDLKDGKEAGFLTVQTVALCI